MVHRRPVYIYLFNVPSFSSRHFNKIKRTSRLGRLLALSLEILGKRIKLSMSMHVKMKIFLVLPYNKLFFGAKYFYYRADTIKLQNLQFSVLTGHIFFLKKG